MRDSSHRQSDTRSTNGPSLIEYTLLGWINNIIFNAICYIGNKGKIEDCNCVILKSGVSYNTDA